MNKLEDLISYTNRLVKECGKYESCSVCPKYLTKICDKIGQTPIGLSTILEYLAEYDLKKSIEEMEKHNKGGQD